MTEKCPVCGKIISANENKCSECGFMELHKVFISKIDAEEWIEKVVKPYKIKYEDEKNNKNKTQIIHFHDGIYTGEISNGKKNGYGEMKYMSGSVYKGEWTDDLINGRGEYKWHYGDIYEGGWKRGKMHGNGIYFWKNGDRYAGEWDNGKRHGYGEMTYADGTVYKGQWENGERKANNQQNLNKQPPANTNNKTEENHIGANIAIFLLIGFVIFIIGALTGGSAEHGFMSLGVAFIIFMYYAMKG